jgi:putative pyruvate formate lyase activating enzyme
MRLTAAGLRARAAEARLHYADCDLCGHRCRVDRTHGPAGRCHEGDGVFLVGAGVHFGEEPPLVGTAGRGPGAPHGSGLVLIGGCNLACRSCETASFSLERRGLFPASAAQLGALFCDLQQKGAANLNLVTPTHVLPALLEGLADAAAHGFSLPVVWNCGGYESLAALRLLDGVVDVYLPDAKYGDDAAAERLSGCKGYTAALGESLREMHRQAGVLAPGEGGLARRGVLARHLVLPGGAAAPEAVLRLCAEVSPDLWVNVMSQYRPLHEAPRLPVVDRRPTRAEVEATLAAGRAAGLRHLLLDGRAV